MRFPRSETAAERRMRPFSDARALSTRDFARCVLKMPSIFFRRIDARKSNGFRKALVRRTVGIPCRVKRRDDAGKLIAAAGIVVLVERLNEMLVETRRFFGGVFRAAAGQQHLCSKFPPEQAEGRVGYAVFPNLGIFLMMVELSTPDVENKTVKIFRYLENAPDCDTGLYHFQQSGGKHVVGVKFSAMCQCNV